MSDEMIIARVRRVCADLNMSDTEFSNEYHVDMEQAMALKVFKSIAMLEVIADELQEGLDREREKEAARAAAAELK